MVNYSVFVRYLNSDYEPTGRRYNAAYASTPGWFMVKHSDNDIRLVYKYSVVEEPNHQYIRQRLTWNDVDETLKYYILQDLENNNFDYTNSQVEYMIKNFSSGQCDGYGHLDYKYIVEMASFDGRW
jgi:hypothetical protein